MQKKKYNGDYIYIHFTFSVMQQWDCESVLSSWVKQLLNYLFFFFFAGFK